MLMRITRGQRDVLRDQLVIELSGLTELVDALVARERDELLESRHYLREAMRLLDDLG